MSRLNLHCELCGRRQASGLLSAAAWGTIEPSPGSTLRACPTCRSKYPNWESKLRALASEGGMEQAQSLGS